VEVVEWIRATWKLRAGEISKDKKTVGAVVRKWKEEREEGRVKPGENTEKKNYVNAGEMKQGRKQRRIRTLRLRREQERKEGWEQKKKT
jgi:hypothetical protein